MRWHQHLLITATCHVWMGAVGSDGYGRFQITNKFDGTRMLTPHQVAARLGFGPIPEGATLLHDCEVRLCCRYGTGHVGVGTQSENMRHAVARGRAVGPRPGRVDVRGKVGASRAIQAALLDTGNRSPGDLAQVLAGVLADGNPMRDMLALFDTPDHAAPPIGWLPPVGPRRGRCGYGRGGRRQSCRCRCSTPDPAGAHSRAAEYRKGRAAAGDRWCRSAIIT